MTQKFIECGTSAIQQSSGGHELRSGDKSCAVGRKKDAGLGDVVGFDPGNRKQVSSRALGQAQYETDGSQARCALGTLGVVCTARHRLRRVVHLRRGGEGLVGRDVVLGGRT